CKYEGKRNNRQIQVIHSRGDHWIVASNTLSCDGKVNVYDSLYCEINKETKIIISILFGPLSIDMIDIERQTGDPITVTFNQSEMRCHLIKCIEDLFLTPFPMI
uniref:Uncharacterized protein n=1 Tax=Amphimedon queenslandica TaxID=400682 RepID=A0A1X7TDW3_AMPQE